MARRHTPYYHKLVALGAEMADRIGFDAAVRFTTVADEHRATRERVGIYDVYYQGAVDVKGSDAEAFLDGHVVNNVARLADGQVLYTSVLNEGGGMIDDLTLVRLSPEHYWLFPTPSRVDIVTNWLTERAAGRHAYVTNIVSGTAYLSIQGPRSRATLAKLTDLDLSTAALPYYHAVQGVVAEVPALVSRTGYSGELGYELFYPRDYSEHVWDEVMAAGEEFGIAPCGLGALRSVRMEKKFPLYGLDLNESTSPLEASLGWTVKFDKRDFVGREALLRQRDEGLTRRLVGIAFDGKSFLPKAGDAVTVGGRQVGSLTSSDTGHSLGRTLAMGYLEPAAAAAGTRVTVTSAESGVSAEGIVHTKAFYDPDRERVRS
jgi:glycine cleavage system T protein (aminomethyltransferase)